MNTTRDFSQQNILLSMVYPRLFHQYKANKFTIVVNWPIFVEN